MRVNCGALRTLVVGVSIGRENHHGAHVTGGIRLVARGCRSLAQTAAIGVHIPGEGVEADAATDDRFVAKLVGKAEPRQEVLIDAFLQSVAAVGLGRGKPQRAGSIGGGIDHVRIERALVAVDFGPARVAFPPQTEVQGEFGGHFEVVLDEGARILQAAAVFRRIQSVPVLHIAQQEVRIGRAGTGGERTGVAARGVDAGEPDFRTIELPQAVESARKMIAPPPKWRRWRPWISVT